MCVVSYYIWLGECKKEDITIENINIFINDGKHAFKESISTELKSEGTINNPSCYFPQGAILREILFLFYKHIEKLHHIDDYWNYIWKITYDNDIIIYLYIPAVGISLNNKQLPINYINELYLENPFEKYRTNSCYSGLLPYEKEFHKVILYNNFSYKSSNEYIKDFIIAIGNNKDKHKEYINMLNYLLTSNRFAKYKSILD